MTTTRPAPAPPHQDGRAALAMGSAATFVPGRCSREGRLALWGGAPRAGHDSTVTVVKATPRSARRVEVACSWMSVAEATDALLDAGLDSLSESASAWRAVLVRALELISRGRLAPACNDGSVDGWRVGPLDPADVTIRAELAAALPLAAFAVPVADGRGRLVVPDPHAAVRDFTDAVADAFVRTAAAPVLAGFDAFAVTEPVEVGGLAEWLLDATAPVAGDLRPGLRLELPEGSAGSFVAVLVVRSEVDPSLTVDAVDLWTSPDAVLARFGPDADSEVLVALRRAARVWSPAAALLEQATPDRIELHEDDVAGLLGDGGDRLRAVGFELLWPASLASGIQLRAVATPAPGAVTAAGLTLEALVEFEWEVALDGEALTGAEVSALAEAKRRLVRVRGQWILVDTELLARLRRPPRRPATAVEALATVLAGAIDVDGEACAVVARGALGELAGRVRSLGDDDRRELPEPVGLVATLRPYQRRGLGWLAAMTDLGVGGCLADDMGLGKTIQLIALHLHRGDDPATAAPTLVVCPSSLLGNWERELARFAPRVPVRRFHGGDRHLEGVAPDEVVLVTYGVVRRDAGELAGVGWGLVVADEAQHVKNPLGATARELRRIPAGARLAMTGTPVENRLSDLWALLDWTTPGLLGPLDRFRRQVAIPIERDRDPDTTDRFARLVRPFLLRRRKTDPGIAPDLPPRTVTDVVVGLTAEQVTLYEATTRDALARIAEAEGIERRGLVLGLLTGLKQICNHPAQFLHQPGPIAGRSAKLAALDELVDAIVDAGDQVLVFTQYVAMARLIERHLAARSVPNVFLHGSLKPVRRDELVARFQAGEVPVFLLSLKAGGTGLNLTAATHVIHYDRWWNPAVEDQASDRAWRIGQTRAVQVHRLTARATLEDRIATLLESKRALADAVVGAGEGWLSELDDDALADLVTLGEDR